MKKILVTGFEPFGGEKINPAQLVLESLPGDICGCEIKKLLLPVEFTGAREAAIKEYDELSLDAVVMLGQAGGRRALTPEIRGRNVMNSFKEDGAHPDNAGYAPDHLEIEQGGPDELRATLPLEKILTAVRTAGVPCELSEDAGEYVCNCLLYSMLRHNGGAVPTGFIHMPYVREQGHKDKPFMELCEIIKGIIAAIGAVAAEL